MLTFLCSICTAQMDFLIPLEIFISPVFFLEGSVNGSIHCINIVTVDDVCFEKNHSFEVSIDSTVNNVIVNFPSFTTVTIIDNEGNYSQFMRPRLEYHAAAYML